MALRSERRIGLVRDQERHPHLKGFPMSTSDRIKSHFQDDRLQAILAEEGFVVDEEAIKQFGHYLDDLELERALENEE